MKDFLLDPITGSLDFSSRDIQFTGNISEYVRQKLYLKLSIFKGEYFLKKSEGLPYFEDILIKNPDLRYVEDLIKTKIFEIPEIEAITSFTLDLNSSTRVMTINFTATLETGDTATLSLEV